MRTSAAPAPAAAAAAPAPATGDALPLPRRPPLHRPRPLRRRRHCTRGACGCSSGCTAAPVKLDLKLPEKSTLDPSVLESTATLASALKLDQDGATKVLGLVDQIASAHAAKLVATAKEQAVRTGRNPRSREARLGEAQHAVQADALKDAELGNGDPKKLEAAAALGQRALAAFFPKEMIDLITDAGSNPIRACSRAW
jgi:hypothetical protein